MNGYQLTATKHPGGTFTLKVFDIVRFNGQSTRGDSLAAVMDSVIFDLGLSVHEVGEIQVVPDGCEFAEEDRDLGRFFRNHTRLEEESFDGVRTYINTRAGLTA
jgi:hypothetical protein